MAGRRMFARTVTTTGRFMRLSAGAKYLYFALGMEADDDGFAEGWVVLRMTGQEEADLRTLEKAGYVKVYGEDLITYITDWDTNNQIRKDRYRESQYANLLNEEPEETPKKAVSSGETGEAMARETLPETTPVQAKPEKRQAGGTSKMATGREADPREQASGTPEPAAGSQRDTQADGREMGLRAAGTPEPAALRTLERDRDALPEAPPARSLGSGREGPAASNREMAAPAKEMTEQELLMLRARLRKGHAEEKRLREKEVLREEREKQGLYYIDIDKMIERIGNDRRNNAGGHIGPRQEAAG